MRVTAYVACAVVILTSPHMLVAAQPSAPTAARGVGENVAKFDDSTPESLAYKYTFPTDAAQLATLMQSNATSLNAAHANIVSRVFSLSACSAFLPHTHPGASEFFVQRDGETAFNVLLNGDLVSRNLTVGGTFLVPQGAIHFFYNNQCSQSNIVTTLNSAAPGFQGFYDGPDVDTLRSTVFTAADLQRLAASGTQNATLDRARAFLQITNDCRSRCGLPTLAPTAPSTYGPTLAPSASTSSPSTPTAAGTPSAPTTSTRPLGQNIAAFDDITPEQLFFKYTFPSNAMPASLLQQSNASSLNAAHANIVSRVFSIKACESFLPHTHPGASEFFVGSDGVLEFNVLLNGAKVSKNVTTGDSFLVPQGAIHYFYNNNCQQTNVITALTSAAPGFLGFYNGTLVDKLRTTVFGTSDMQALAGSGTEDPVLDRSRAFLTITNDCAARCNLSPTSAPTAAASTDAPTVAPGSPTCPPGAALIKGSCEKCLSTATTAGLASRGGAVCYKPETYSPTSSQCSPIFLMHYIALNSDQRKQAPCLDPTKRLAIIFLPIKSAKYTYINAGSYIKSSFRLGKSIRANSAQSNIFLGVNRFRVTFLDQYGVIKKNAGGSVTLTGAIQRAGALLDICFQTTVPVCRTRQ